MLEEKPLSTKRTLARWSGLLATSAIVFAACSTPAGGTAAPSASAQAASQPRGLHRAGAPPAASAAAGPSDQADRRRQGGRQLTTIALPHDWCNYGEVIDGFKAKYGIKVNELNPDAGSGDEIEAIKANKDNKGPQAPDVIDVGLSFGPSAKARA